MLLLIGLVLMVFLLMARTRLFRAGQIGELMSNYSRFLGVTGVHFLLFFGTRIYRVVRTLPSWGVQSFVPPIWSLTSWGACLVQMAVLDSTPHVGIWHMPMFFVLFIAQKIVQLAWYHHIIKTVRELLDGLLAETRRRSS
jgi:hypothetical protein